MHSNSLRHFVSRERETSGSQRIDALTQQHFLHVVNHPVLLEQLQLALDQGVLRPGTLHDLLQHVVLICHVVCFRRLLATPVPSAVHDFIGYVATSRNTQMHERLEDTKTLGSLRFCGAVIAGCAGRASLGGVRNKERRCLMHPSTSLGQYCTLAMHAEKRPEAGVCIACIVLTDDGIDSSV